MRPRPSPRPIRAAATASPARGDAAAAVVDRLRARTRSRRDRRAERTKIRGPATKRHHTDHRRLADAPARRELARAPRRARVPRAQKLRVPAGAPRRTTAAQPPPRSPRFRAPGPSPRGHLSDESRRRRGCHVDISRRPAAPTRIETGASLRSLAARTPLRRVAAPPRLPRGYFADTSRGGAMAPSRTSEASLGRTGPAEASLGHMGPALDSAAARTWISCGDRRRRRGSSVETGGQGQDRRSRPVRASQVERCPGGQGAFEFTEPQRPWALAEESFESSDPRVGGRRGHQSSSSGFSREQVAAPPRLPRGYSAEAASPRVPPDISAETCERFEIAFVRTRFYSVVLRASTSDALLQRCIDSGARSPSLQKPSQN